MGQRYLNPSEKTDNCQFRLVTLTKRQYDNKTVSFQTVIIDDNIETLRFFQENMKEVLQNVRMVKRLEALDNRKLAEERQQEMACGFCTD